MFEVGQQVVCVDAKGCPELAKGSSYVVERIIRPYDVFSDHAGDLVENHGEVGVWIVGGHDFRDPYEEACAYQISRFRQVTRTRDTLSIESFMTIKTGQPEGPRRVVGPVSPNRERA